MLTQNKILSLRIGLKKQLTKGIGEALNEILTLLKPDSMKFDDVILLLERFNRTDREMSAGLITPDDANMRNNRIAKSTLDLINNLQLKDVILPA